MFYLIVFHREGYSIVEIGSSKIMFLCPGFIRTTCLQLTTTKIQL
jgi:hypothetical protein